MWEQHDNLFIYQDNTIRAKDEMMLTLIKRNEPVCTFALKVPRHPELWQETETINKVKHPKERTHQTGFALSCGIILFHKM